MDIEFGNLKREELKAAVTLAARAYRNYAYVALYFPDDEERFRSLHAFMNCLMKRTLQILTLMSVMGEFYQRWLEGLFGRQLEERERLSRHGRRGM